MVEESVVEQEERGKRSKIELICKRFFLSSEKVKAMLTTLTEK